MKLNLKREDFKALKTQLINENSFVVNAFKYETGVEALEVSNGVISFIILPYEGQQIWRLKYMGREISMQDSTVTIPVLSDTFGDCYTPFLMHCGISAMGVPQSDDNHPPHGELPMAVYDSAYLVYDKDDDGEYVLIGGILDKTIENKHYLFNPEVKLYKNTGVLKVNINLKIINDIPLDYMYLCHLNFRPFNGAKLKYSADYGKVKPYYLNTDDKRNNYYMLLENDPSIHNEVGNKYECYDPEMCLNVKFKGDENNYAYSLQYEEGVGACYISHPINYLPEGIRWISRTKTVDAMGLVLPATAEHLGRERAKRNGQIKVLQPNESISFTIETGYLNNSEALNVINKINEIME